MGQYLFVVWFYCSSWKLSLLDKEDTSHDLTSLNIYSSIMNLCDGGAKFFSFSKPWKLQSPNHFLLRIIHFCHYLQCLLVEIFGCQTCVCSCTFIKLLKIFMIKMKVEVNDKESNVKEVMHSIES
jgi:hypothetical protein